jgi:hypothetical protein
VTRRQHVFRKPSPGSVPTFFDPNDRPAEMFRNGRELDPTFTDDEVLYSRCAPQHVDDEDEAPAILVAAFRAPNTSVLRAKYSEPDHARWDSAEDCGDRPPQLHRDAYVLKVPISALPSKGQIAEETKGDDHDFKPAHVPYEDSYAHAEIHAFKRGSRIERENQFKNTADKAAKYLLLRRLADHASIVLGPGEITPAHPQ